MVAGLSKNKGWSSLSDHMPFFKFFFLYNGAPSFVASPFMNLRLPATHEYFMIWLSHENILVSGKGNAAATSHSVICLPLLSCFVNMVLMTESIFMSWRWKHVLHIASQGSAGPCVITGILHVHPQIHLWWAAVPQIDIPWAATSG